MALHIDFIKSIQTHLFKKSPKDVFMKPEFSM